MKHLLVSILSILSVFGFNLTPNASFSLSEIEYIDDYIVLTLKMTSDDVMVISQEMTYNPNELELIKVEENSYFTYTYSKPKENEDKTNTIRMLFDSTDAYKSIEYAKIYFKPIVNNITTDVTVDNIETSDLNYSLDKPYGSLFTITIKDTKVSVLKKEFTSSNVIADWAQENKVLLIEIAIGLIVLIIISNITRKIITSIKKKKNPFKEVKTPKKEVIDADGNKHYFTDQKGIDINEHQEIEEALEEIQDIENEAKEEPITDDVLKGKYEVFILLLLVGSLFITSVVYATNNEDKLTGIRECIVNNKYDSKYDNNEDKKVNVVDLVYELGIENATNKGFIKFNSVSDGEKVTEQITKYTEITEPGMQDLWGNVQ